MFSRTVEIASSAASIAWTFLKGLSIPAGMTASAGGTIVNTENLLTYAGKAPFSHLDPNQNFNSHPITITNVGVNVWTNFATRVTPVFPPAAQEDAPNIESLAPAPDEIDSEEEQELIAHAKDNAWKTNCASLTLKILFMGVNSVAAAGVALGTYNGGKAFCGFVAHGTGASLDDEAWKYYVVHSAALFISFSSVLRYWAYVARTSNKNCDYIVDCIDKKKFPAINKRLLTTASILSILNIITGTSMNFISALKSWEDLNKDINTFPAFSTPPNVVIPEWLMMMMASVTCGAGAFVEITTTIPELYKQLNQLIEDDPEYISAQQSPSPKWLDFLKGFSYLLGIWDAVATGATGFSSICLTAEKKFGYRPYGFIMAFGLLCSLSKAICHGSFNVKKGIDDSHKDIKNLIARYSSQSDDQFNIQDESQASDFPVSSDFIPDPSDDSPFVRVGLV